MYQRLYRKNPLSVSRVIEEFKGDLGFIEHTIHATLQDEQPRSVVAERLIHRFDVLHEKFYVTLEFINVLENYLSSLEEEEEGPYFQVYVNPDQYLFYVIAYPFGYKMREFLFAVDREEYRYRSIEEILDEKREMIRRKVEELYVKALRIANKAYHIGIEALYYLTLTDVLWINAIGPLETDIMFESDRKMREAIEEAIIPEY